MSSSTRTASACNSCPPSLTSPATNGTPVSRRIVVETVPPTGSTKWDLVSLDKAASVGPEPLYDVVNPHGKFLLLGVTHAAACQAIDEHQTEPDAHPQWQGDMAIRSVRLGPPLIGYRASVLRTNGRLVACCDIDHFMLSGLPVPDLFARLRPELVAAIEDAAAREPQIDGAPRSPSVQMDVGDPDPGMTLWVHSPTAALDDLGACFDSLQAIVTRFAAAEMAAEGNAA